MSATFAVETESHRDAVTLLRALSGYNAWTIQLGEQRWLVVGSADTNARESIRYMRDCEGGESFHPELKQIDIDPNL